ncbi:FAD-dependent oxidoreductase [Paractinoplanes rishiriensis]|uniref:FAD-dependent monooxygenase n=1 Tax=Paractinoplanes rishiriensis TaxID=1050105 RepID=A0A919JY37_9ACTN|nr:NAD(P)/FAD-dependent oxidoreductase [Actinoplanes rishiriensis]GIE95359.1 FAD-dependent monooxygenase [Actinoplanes rishiriensis]
MKIVIAGGGIGGLALARGLAGSGHHVRVLEQSPGLRTGGAAVTIFSNGAAALAGLGAPLAGFGGRLDTLRFDAADGRTIVTADLSVPARRTGFPVTSVPRDRLVEHLARGVDVEFGREIAGVDVHRNGVTAVDTNGDHHEADVLVGADGHRSAVRRAILDPAPAAPNEWTTWQGLTPALPDLAAGTTGVCVVGDAGLVGMLPSGDGLLMWWFDVHRPLDGPLAARFAGYGPLVGRLLDQVRDDQAASFGHVTHRVPDHWGCGSATLLGDAAHAFPPTQAQGANQALEDAWLLSRTLRADPASIPGTLRRYESLRARRVRKVSRRAASEKTNKPMPFPVRVIAGRIPPALIGRAYAAQLRGISSVLNDESV